MTVQIDTGARLDAELKSFHELVAKPDPGGLIARYPVPESGALDGIAKGFGLGSRSAYEAMALKLLEDDGALLQTARDHLKYLIAELSSAASSIPSTT